MATIFVVTLRLPLTDCKPSSEGLLRSIKQLAGSNYANKNVVWFILTSISLWFLIDFELYKTVQQFKNRMIEKLIFVSLINGSDSKWWYAKKELNLENYFHERNM